MAELCTSDIDRGVEELKIFHKFFHRFFRVKTRDVIKQSLQYQQGLLVGEERKNMTNMEKTVPDCDHQSLQNFISDSKWDEEGVISEIQRIGRQLSGGRIPGIRILELSDDHRQAALPSRGLGK